MLHLAYQSLGVLSCLIRILYNQLSRLARLDTSLWGTSCSLKDQSCNNLDLLNQKAIYFPILIDKPLIRSDKIENSPVISRFDLQ